MKLLLPGVGLLLAATACGGRPAATTLKIEISGGSGARTYRLTCDPAGGMRHAATTCAALRRQPDMLVERGALLCGPGAAGGDRIRVTGLDHGRPVHAAFQNVCSGGGEGFGAWTDVLEDAGPG